MDKHMTKRYMKAQMMSTKPIVAKRAGYDETASSLRGTHMHEATAHGRAAVTALTSSHDFSDPQLQTLTPEAGRTMDLTSRKAASAFGLTQGSLGGTLL